MNRRIALLLMGGGVTLAGQQTAESLYTLSEGKAPEEAIPLLLESIRLRPTFEANYRLGVTYIRVQEFEKALGCLKEAFRLTSPAQAADRAHVFFRRAQAHQGLGELLPAYLEVQQSLAFEDHPTVRALLHKLQDALASVEIDAKDMEAAFAAARDFEVRETNSKPPTVPLWVNFEVNKHTMTPAGLRQAETLATELTSPGNAPYRFLIVGHTDKTGSDAINLPLSERRAGEVRKYLLGRGLDEQLITAKGRGSHEPLRVGNTEAEFRVNRRVDVVLLKR